MKKNLFIFLLLPFILSSCGTSKIMMADGITSLSDYEYVVFGDESNGSAALDELLFTVHQEISNTRLKPVSKYEAIDLILLDKKILTPRINITSQYWDGGQTYITVSFYDYDSGMLLAMVKSTGIGLFVEHDQSIALEEIIKKLHELLD